MHLNITNCYTVLVMKLKMLSVCRLACEAWNIFGTFCIFALLNSVIKCCYWLYTQILELLIIDISYCTITGFVTAVENEIICEQRKMKGLKQTSGKRKNKTKKLVDDIIILLMHRLLVTWRFSSCSRIWKWPSSRKYSSKLRWR